MKVAVSSTGSDLSAAVDARFGRCRCFLIVDTETREFTLVGNTNAELSGSAGIQSAGMLADQGIDAVITGNCGPKAMAVFEQMKIPVITGVAGSVGDAVARYSRGDLTPASQASVAAKSGVAPEAAGAPMGGTGGGGRGMGMGGGRGMGGCGGRGMGGGRGLGGGRGMGRRCDPAATTRPATTGGRAEELSRLQQEADALRRQMDAIQAKIDELG
jgi:predicted Fe-Mo cluster-binding NifX family protein